MTNPTRMPNSENRFLRRRTHAIQRAHERYGLQIALHEYDYLNLKIRRMSVTERTQARLVELPARRVAYQFKHKGVNLIAVYSHHEHQITTFLLPEHLARYQ